MLTGVLTGDHVHVEPLSADHVTGLVAAAGEDPGLYRWSTVPQGVEAVQRYVAAALRGARVGHMCAYAVVRRVVGSTRFANIERWEWPTGHEPRGRTGTPDACEIGYTWLARSAIRTAINTEVKRLLLTHAFEQWRVHRVSLRTDVHNQRSRAAIERLGAHLDGILRADRPSPDGAVRDSAYYTITAPQWPSVKARLAELARF